jgi:hypothetical protein
MAIVIIMAASSAFDCRQQLQIRNQTQEYPVVVLHTRPISNSNGYVEGADRITSVYDKKTHESKDEASNREITISSTSSVE